MMKKFFFAAIIAAMTFAFTSCNENGSDDPLVGTWKEVNNYTGGSRSELILKLTADKHFNFSNGLYMADGSTHVYTEYEGTYFVEGNIVTIHYERMVKAINYDDSGRTYPFDEKFRYEIDGKTLKVTWIGDGVEWTDEFTKQ